MNKNFPNDNFVTRKKVFSHMNRDVWEKPWKTCEKYLLLTLYNREMNSKLIKANIKGRLCTYEKSRSEENFRVVN